MALARLFMFWRRRKKGRERNREDGLSGKGPRGWSEANSLAHVADVVGSKEEVLKSLVAHFEHAGEKKQQRVRHKHELEAHQREIKTHESSTQHTEILRLVVFFQSDLLINSVRHGAEPGHLLSSWTAQLPFESLQFGLKALHLFHSLYKILKAQTKSSEKMSALTISSCALQRSRCCSSLC